MSETFADHVYARGMGVALDRCLMCEAHEVKAHQYKGQLEYIATLNEGLVEDCEAAVAQSEKWRDLYNKAETKYRLCMFALVAVLVYSIFRGKA